MKNKRSLTSLFKSRIIALILAVVMILTSIDLLAIFGDSLAFPTIAVAETLPKDAVIRNDALHFFIRHWNTAEDDDAMLNDGTQKENGNFFVIVEGYIVPVVKQTEEDKEKGYNYHFYLVDQSTGDLIKLSDYAGDNGQNSAYIKSVNRKTGAIVLNVNLLATADGEPFETFAGFSISAGHGAVSYASNNSYITITYDKNITLVKGHIFYTATKDVKRGTTITDGDDSEYSILFGTENPEIDTMTVYTWTEHGASQDSKRTAGGILTDDNGNVIKKGDESKLPEGALEAGDVVLTTFYSTTEGLHTNKTLMQSDKDDRMFLFDLETWYTENYASQVALMLDASGGMAFALDKPSQMTVWSALATTLNKKTEDIKAIYNGYKVLKGASTLTNLANALTNAVGYEVTEDDVAQLFDMIDKANTDDLESRFLENKLLGLLLNPRNTDNSAIGVNGYNYYVTANNKDYEPLGYWEGSITDTPDESYEFAKSSRDVTTGWAGDFPDYNMATNGLNLTAATNASFAPGGIVLDAKPSSGTFTISFKLRAGDGSDPAAATRKIKEILYIGSMSGDTLTESPNFKNGGEGYYRLFRDEGSSSNRLRANSWSGRGNNVTDIDGVFNNLNATGTVFTLVFDGETVTSYMNGEIGSSGSTNFDNGGAPFKFAGNDINIIINGIQDGYNGKTLYIDDIYVYDGALEASAVKTLATEVGAIAASSSQEKIAASAESLGDLIGVYTFTNSNPKPDGTTSGTTRWWLRNSANKAKNANKSEWNTQYGIFASLLEERLHIASNNGGALTKTIANTLYAYYTSDDGVQHTLGELRSDISQTGWYHISHRGDAARLKNSGTNKCLYFLEPNGTLTVNDTLGDLGDSNNQYTTAENISTRFYIDSAGNLRCFYGASLGSAYCSYVYYLKDEQYTKAEGLQRILANFTTQLLDRSLGSEVSAVQFSKEGRHDNIMLDWTADSAEISGIMSQTRGADSKSEWDGTANAYTKSSRGIPQYNYALTGSTDFASGLKAFKDSLISYKENDKGAKFFVIFTDGESNSKADEDAAKEIVTEMKGDYDYTVICVFFGDITQSANDHAIEFLKELAGDPSDIKNNKAAGEAYFYDANDMDTLMERFEKDILELMAKQLEGYTVKDYIDPRFDLVGQSTSDDDERGTVWQLLAKGRVKLLGTSIVHNLSKTTGVTFPIVGTSKPDVGNPMLYYDTDKDMYYLEWTDQIIPPSSIGAPQLQIWRARVVLRAKDDFIGGNAILTNGNDAYMNWVYNPMDLNTTYGEQAEQNLVEYNAYLARRRRELSDAYDELEAKAEEEGEPLEYTKSEYIAKNMKQYTDKKSKHDASSGTTDVKIEYPVKTENGEPVLDKEGNPIYDKANPLDAYVSKGFPRTTVNVPLTKIDVGSKYKVVYMGEVVSPAKLLTEIEGDTVTDSYYLEYLKRYAYQRYLFSKSDKELNKPIWDILNDWLQFGNATVSEKSFSIPYMYLPSVEFDAETGKIKTDTNGKATILNSTGFNTEAQGGKVFDDEDGLLADVVGILTYRWEILEPTTDKTLYGNQAATRDYVKNDTERIRYALTVGFTPLREGDTLAGDNGLNAHDDDGEPIFAEYLPIRGVNSAEKWKWKDATIGETLRDGKFIFDRETRVNNIYIKEKETRTVTDAEGNPEIGEDGEPKTVTETVFAWSPKYKPAIYARQLQNDVMLYTNTDDTVNLINDGNGQFTNGEDENGNQIRDFRTIKGYSVYSLNVVSGDIVLEFKLQTGELENLLNAPDGKAYENDETCDLDQEFTLNATRSFTEAETHIQDLKDTQYLSDYDYKKPFKLTFKFDSEEIKAQLHAMYIADREKYADYKGDYEQFFNSYNEAYREEHSDEPDFEVAPLEDDAFGFVKIYAKVTEVECTWNENTVTKTTDEDGNTKYHLEGTDPQTKTIYEHLPIGAYEFSLADANKNNQDLLTSLRFGEIFSVGNDDNGKAEFITAYDKFNDVVLNGLHTSNEKIVDKEGNIDYTPTPAQRRYDQGDKAGQLVYYTNPDSTPFTEDKAENYEEGEDSNGNKAWIDKESGTVAYWYDKNLKVWRYANGERVPYYWSESEMREITPDDVDADDADKENEGMAVKSRSITHYIADSKAGEGKDEGKKVSFYLGTAQSYDEDGNLIYIKNPDDAEKYYPEHRVGIVGLNSGTTKLTIVEDGGKENESFLYRITGTTLSGVKVDVTVSVKGGSHATVDLVAGNYTVTEVSNWSWRYDAGIVTEAVEWKHLSDKDPVWNKMPGKGYGYEEDTADVLTEWAWNEAGNVLEATEAASEVSGWTEVTQTDEKVSANITLYTDTYDAVITFTHGSNGKTWVGGESYDNALFPEKSSVQGQDTEL